MRNLLKLRISWEHPHILNKEHLYELLEEYGKVQMVRIFKGLPGSKQGSFGMVELDQYDMEDSIISSLPKVTLEGVPIAVSISYDFIQPKASSAKKNVSIFEDDLSNDDEDEDDIDDFDSDDENDKAEVELEFET